MLSLEKILNPSVTLNKCLNCESEDIALFDTYIHKGIQLKYSICKFCGLIFQNPTFSSEEWDDFYKFQYRKLYHNSEKPIQEVVQVQVDRAANYVNIIKSNVKNIRSHLDIGCSAGELMIAIGQVYDLKYQYGIEPGDAYRVHCKSKDLCVYALLEELRKNTDDKFELITMCHVLEHIPHPISYLNYIVEHLLAEDGYLFIEVPNVRGGRSFEVAHPICFSKKTLQETLQAASMHIIYDRAHGVPKNYHKNSKIYLATLSKKGVVGDKKAFKKASSSYLLTSKLMMYKGMTNDNMIMFFLKMPYRLLKYGIHW